MGRKPANTTTNKNGTGTPAPATAEVLTDRQKARRDNAAAAAAAYEKRNRLALSLLDLVIITKDNDTEGVGVYLPVTKSFFGNSAGDEERVNISLHDLEPLLAREVTRLANDRAEKKAHAADQLRLLLTENPELKNMIADIVPDPAPTVSNTETTQE